MIKLTDNNVGNAPIYNRSEVAPLFPLSEKSISELCKENENLLVFPYSIDSAEDQIGDESVFTIGNTSDPDRVSITTGNIMGFVGIGDLQIKIQSRFDADSKDFLLHYILQKVMSFNLFDLNHNSEQEDVFDFMMFMFPFFLKSALRQGVYREYQHFEHNDANVRGTIDVSRHIQRNIPFGGKIAYSTREHSHDNGVTQLIRHTIEFMRTKKYGQAVLNIDNETKDNVSTIVEHTPSYNKLDRGNIIQRNLRLKTHPYYTEYRPLQSLCLQILRMEEIRYGESEDLVCGILFDGAWLWEEYVNTILHKEGFIHPENKLGKGKIFLFEDVGDDGKIHRSGSRFPDFYRDGQVLDAKYKKLGSYDKVSKIDRDDIHQLITYMTRLKADNGGFIAPLDAKQIKIPTSHVAETQSRISIFGIEISKASSYQDFCREMAEHENEFLKTIK